METKEKKMNEYARPVGVAVKVSVGRITALALLMMLIVIVVGVLLFNYVWGSASNYSAGYELGYSIRIQALSFKGFMVMALCMFGYILLQYIALYCFSGRDHRSLRWNMDWKSWGFLLTKPLSLKYYRVSLLLPFFIMGIIPMIHGFCTGNDIFYFIGLFCLIGSCGDCYYFWKLRSFNDNDKIIDGEESFNATIIKESY